VFLGTRADFSKLSAPSRHAGWAFFNLRDYLCYNIPMPSSKNPKLIVANWKMNPRTLKEAKKIFNDFKKESIVYTNKTVVLCPPVLFLRELKSMYRGTKIFWGSQDIHFDDEGQHTSELSVPMIKDAGARFVIVGHSEVRAQGDTDEAIAKKVFRVLKEDMHVLLCVGEKVHDAQATYLTVVAEQLRSALRFVTPSLVKKLNVVYEPVWAIGKGATAMNTHDIHFMNLFIKKELMHKFGKNIGATVPILYGGSVDSYNARAIVEEGATDGLLIGRASLNPGEFAKIINSIA
jgi:triosephosphate isomerase